MSNNDIPYETYEEELIKLRRYFHANPELSLEEKETANYIEKYLKNIGLKPQRIGDYGISAMIYASKYQDKCKTIAIRAEMDAIAVREKNDFLWKSQKEGIMHACGHDAILACTLVLAKLCSQYSESLTVNVKFIFQPAEENGKGTQIMLDGGVMENPHVDYFVMFHFANDAPLGLEFQRGPSSATIGSIKIKINGKAGHWGNSKFGIDSIGAAGKILQVIEKINNTYSTDAPFILGIGLISGGSARNVIAEETVLEGTLRACKVKDYYSIRKLFLEELEKIQDETGTIIESQVEANPTLPIINDNDLVDLALEVGKKLWNEDCRLMNGQYLSGDSASYYFNYAKGIFFVFTGEKINEENFPLHSGKFDFDESVMCKSLTFLHKFIQAITKLRT